MAAEIPPFGEEIRARIEEARDRVMTKVDEIRARFGGGQGGILGKKILGNKKILGKKGVLGLGILDPNQGVVRRFLPTGPRKYISPGREEFGGRPMWYNSHTLGPGELAALPKDRRLRYPLEKDRVPVGAVAPKVLNK